MDHKEKGHNLTYILRGYTGCCVENGVWGLGRAIVLKVKWEDAGMETRKPDNRL